MSWFEKQKMPKSKLNKTPEQLVAFYRDSAEQYKKQAKKAKTPEERAKFEESAKLSLWIAKNWEDNSVKKK